MSLSPSRRFVSLIVVLIASSSPLHGWQPPSPAALARHKRALERWDAHFNPEVQMIRRPFSSPGYHTALHGGYVHPTRESLLYALALLDHGEAGRRDRACAILRRVVALQNADATSPSCGVWPWYLEEPLERMAQPDFNWAAFNGATLVQIVRDHRARLPADLAAEVEAAVLRACGAIKRRDVGPGYTNIAAMAAYVTIVAGETLPSEEFLAYGRTALRRLHAHTRATGAFEEYNSPHYQPIVIQELSRLRAHSREAELAPVIEELLAFAWEETAAQFHAPTRQWSGPQSRTYTSLLPTATLAFLQRAFDGALDFGVDLPELDEIRLPLRCPPELVNSFRELAAPRTVTRRFIPRSDTVGTTYLHPQFSLGSINHGDLWNQRRALLLHMGTVERPGYLQLRFLKDGKDFASAQLLSAQHEGTVLGAVTLVTDGGDSHLSLDMVRAARITAGDLRVRFELGGPAADDVRIVPPSADRPAMIDFAGLTLSLAIHRATFDGAAATFEVGQAQDRRWLDVVLRQGAPQTIALNEIADAIVAFTLAVGPAPRTEISAEGNQLTLAGATLRVQAPLRPEPRRWDDSYHAPLGAGGGYR